MVDAPVLGTGIRRGVEVRVLSPAPGAIGVAGNALAFQARVSGSNPGLPSI